MIYDILKNLYFKLPGNFRMIIINIYYLLRIKKIYKIYNSPDYFPLNNIENVHKPIFSNSNSEGYFYRYYQEKEIVHHLSPEDLLKYKYEIVYASYYKNKKFEFKCKENSVLPISMENHKDFLEISCNGKLIDKIKNLPPKRYQYFSAKKGHTYNIESEKGFVVGKPILQVQKNKHKKKFVLCIFIDGLVDPSELGNYQDKDIMPHTADFFKLGTRFRNNFSNAEWTLPSVPSFFTGCRQQKHGFFSPKDNHIIGKNDQILSEIFQEDGYLTFQSCGNWRKSPGYGYVKGFDRTIYKKELSASEVIFSFLEHMRAFKDRDNFAWLTFMEVHHLLKVVPDVSNQIYNNIYVTPWYDPDNKNKSVFISKDEKLIDIYINEIKRLDYYLKIIYDFIRETYKDNEIIISLVSDHGQAFLSEDTHPLSFARTKVPWFLCGDGIKKQDCYEFTENIDLFETLIKHCNLKIPKNNYDSIMPYAVGGKEKRKYIFAQSIYPGQSYKAVFRDQYGESRYESKSNVSSKGLIQGPIELKYQTSSNNVKRPKKEHYKNILLEKVNEWNNRN
jgi:hypothetical protein